MPTAYLSPSLLQDLTNVSVSPGAGNTGYALVWNNTSGRFELAPVGILGNAVATSISNSAGSLAAPSYSFSGDSDTGLFSLGSNAIGFSCGGVQNLALSGNNAFLPGALNLGGHGGGTGVAFALRTASNENLEYRSANALGPFSGVAFDALNDARTDLVDFVVRAKNLTFIGFGNTPLSFRTDSTNRLIIAGTGELTVLSTTESTSTTTGAVRIDGGLGVAKNINIGGNLRFDGGTIPATATSAGTTGDIRYDGSHLYICTATNTWRRAALSTW